jgi:RNA polymerase sigma factor (sigma-70 family)
MNLNTEVRMQDVAGGCDMDVEPVEEKTTRVLSDAQARDLVMRVVAQYADSLLKTARRHSLCADDAQDAYQRTMEIFVRRAPTLDPERAYKWVHTVCKHEAMAVRRQRQQLVSSEEPDFDREEARHLPSPEERLVSFERLRRSAEALQRLKPQELRALWLKAEGFSYAEICEQTGWTHTKVNRCIAEGRRAFMERYAGIEDGAECERWLPLLAAIVDGEASPDQLLEVRPHLRNCPGCRATVRAMHSTAAPLTALFPFALAPMAAAHVHEPASGALVRLYEALTGGIHERAASAALKVQTAVEAASAGKLAAIAASAAAIAGGSAVVADTAATGHEARGPVGAVHTTATARVSAPAGGVTAGRTIALPARARTVAHRAAAPVRRTEFAGGHGGSARHEFGVASTAAAANPSSTVVSSGSPEPTAPRREFSSEFGG